MIQRYNLYCQLNWADYPELEYSEDKEGEWVKWEDCLALLNRVEELEHQLEVLAEEAAGKDL